MSQPSFWCVANLGDVNPLNHGGKFVCIDRTGIYPPELVVIEEAENEDSITRVKYAIQLDRLTAIKDQSGKIIGLSDNRFHVDHCAWFGDRDSLCDVCGTAGASLDSLMSMFLSSSPVDNANAYVAALAHYGCENFGADQTRIPVGKAKLICDTFLQQIEEAKSWHWGYFPATER